MKIKIVINESNRSYNFYYHMLYGYEDAVMERAASLFVYITINNCYSVYIVIVYH